MNLKTLMKLSFLALFIQPCASQCAAPPGTCCPDTCNSHISDAMASSGSCAAACEGDGCNGSCNHCINKDVIPNDPYCRHRGADGSNCPDCP